jgi:pimeloyl-ACP methyl ester carboxylesterase
MQRGFIGSLIVIGVLIFLYMTVSWLVVDQSLVAKPKEITEYPSNYSLDYESISFSSSDDQSITLRGWWIPQQNAKGTIIWVHGLDSARDGNVEFLSSVHKEGYSILTFDLRGHGESDKVAMGAGQHEQQDVLGAIRWVKQQEPSNKIGLIGISLGGAIVILSGDNPDITAIVADSSFASIPELIEEEVAGRTPMPAWGAAILKPGIIAVAKWFRNVDILAVNPAKEIGQITYPVALIHCKQSERVPFTHAKRILANAPQGSPTLFLDNCNHAEGWEKHKERYAEFVFRYLNQRLNS